MRDHCGSTSPKPTIDTRSDRTAIAFMRLLVRPQTPSCSGTTLGLFGDLLRAKVGVRGVSRLGDMQQAADGSVVLYCGRQAVARTY